MVSTIMRAPQVAGIFWIEPVCCRDHQKATVDKVGRGRAELETLFTSSDARVRGTAAAYLIDLVPERAVPLLGEIEESEHANSAHFNAHWALLAWEREQKSRFNYLSEIRAQR